MRRKVKVELVYSVMGESVEVEVDESSYLRCDRKPDQIARIFLTPTHWLWVDAVLHDPSILENGNPEYVRQMLGAVHAWYGRAAKPPTLGWAAVAAIFGALESIERTRFHDALVGATLSGRRDKSSPASA